MKTLAHLRHVSFVNSEYLTALTSLPQRLNITFGNCEVWGEGMQENSHLKCTKSSLKKNPDCTFMSNLVELRLRCVDSSSCSLGRETKVDWVIFSQCRYSLIFSKYFPRFFTALWHVMRARLPLTLSAMYMYNLRKVPINGNLGSPGPRALTDASCLVAAMLNPVNAIDMCANQVNNINFSIRDSKDPNRRLEEATTAQVTPFRSFPLAGNPGLRALTPNISYAIRRSCACIS